MSSTDFMTSTDSTRTAMNCRSCQRVVHNRDMKWRDIGKNRRRPRVDVLLSGYLWRLNAGNTKSHRSSPITSSMMSWCNRLLWGGEGVNHVKRDWLEIFNVNCDLYLFFCVKRDWGYLRETWSVIYIQRDPWLRHLFPRENDTNRPKFAYLTIYY